MLSKHNQLLQFFSYNHLPEDIQKVSKPFCKLAEELCLVLGLWCDLEYKLKELRQEYNTLEDNQKNIESEAVVHEIDVLFYVLPPSEDAEKAVRSLLQAKECAVRSEIMKKEVKK